jgi:hypothetical protein
LAKKKSVSGTAARPWRRPRLAPVAGTLRRDTTQRPMLLSRGSPGRQAPVRAPVRGTGRNDDNNGRNAGGTAHLNAGGTAHLVDRVPAFWREAMKDE